MKAPSTLLAISSFLTLVGTTSARADEVALTFELPPAPALKPVEAVPETTMAVAAPAPGPQPLSIPPGAGSPPMRSHSAQQLPAGVYRQAVAAGLNAGNLPAALLPPAPPLERTVPLVAQTPETPPDSKAADSKAADSKAAATVPPDVLGFNSFDKSPPAATNVANAKPVAPAQPTDPLMSLFEGGTDSLVARAVGSAEGTRTASGGITSAYYGHSDPGNGVWNMGTFSYQHGARSAAEADQKQLNRLKSQSQVLKSRAIKHGLNLNLEETLNGIDLANQSPLASIGRVGYIERLVEARGMGYTGSEAVVVARTRSYINPDTQRWNAPGLGNTLESITRDQRRRANAVSQAIAAYQQEHTHIDWQYWAMLPPAESVVAANPATPPKKALKEKADIAFRLWTDERESTAEPSEHDPTAAATGSLWGADAADRAEIPLAEDQPNTLLASTSKVSLQVPKTLVRLAESVVGEAPSTQASRSAASLLPGFAEPADLPDVVAHKLKHSASKPVGNSESTPASENNPPWEAPDLARDSAAIEPSTQSMSPPATMQAQIFSASEPKQEAQPPTEQENPSWAETREKYQTMKTSTSPVSLEQEQAPLSFQPQAANQPTGAFPETKVLPPLREDLEAVVLPSQAQSEHLPAGDPPPDRAAAAHPLPEGLRERLRTRANQDNDEVNINPKSLPDQVTEAVLELDLPTLPGLE